MKELVSFAKYIHEHCLEEISSKYAARLKEAQPEFLKEYLSMEDDRFISLIKTDFNNFLQQLANDSGEEHVKKNIELWKNDQVPGIRRDQLGLKDLIKVLSMRKYCFIQFLPEYTNDVKKATQVMLELGAFYDYYRSEIYQTFVEITYKNLALEKELLETVLDTTTEEITGLDKEFKVTVWNKTVAKRTGIKKEDIIGKPVFDVFPNYFDSEADIIKRAQNGEKIHLEDLPSKSQTGHYDFDIVPLKDNIGRIIGSLSFTRDVTERKKNIDLINQANEELRKKQKELNAVNHQLKEQVKILKNTQNNLELNHRFINSIVQNTPDFITVYHLKEKSYIFANRWLEEYLGYDKGSVNNNRFEFLLSIVHPEDSDRFKSFFRNYKSSPEKEYKLEYRIKTADGEYRWIRSTYSVLADTDLGEPTKIVGISRDITVEKESTQKLEEALDYYLDILDDFPALIWRSDNSGICNYFNQTWLHFTGRTLEQENGNGWVEGVHPDDVKKCLDIYTENFKKQQPFEMEYRLRRYDGTYRWLLDIGKPLVGFDNEFKGFLGACFDIQDRKDFELDVQEKNMELAAALEELQSTEEQLVSANELLEQNVEERTKELAASKEELKKILENTVELNYELSKRENFLASILEQTPVPTWITDARGYLIQVNQAFTDLLGEVNKSGKFNLLHDEFFVSQPYFPEIRDVFDNGNIARFSLCYHPGLNQFTEDSTHGIHLNVTIFPIKNNDGEVINVVGKAEDITERIRAEKALKASEAELRLITESLPVLISYVDKELCYRFVNKAYTDWFKKDKEEIIGKKIVDLIGTHNYSRIEPFIAEVLKGRTLKVENTLQLDNHTKKDVLITYIPYHRNGSPDGFYAMISDVSPLKIAQQDLMNKNQELLRINSDLDNFIYTASHDLKSPIVNLEGLIHAIERTLSAKMDPREMTLFNMMNTSIGKLKNTINYLSDVTKIAKNFEKNIQHLSIPEIVADVKEDIDQLIKESNATIIENYEVKEVDFSKGNLKSVLYNLISNALKFRAPDKKAIVNIVTRIEDEHLLICVEDNGLGLSLKEQGKLFTMFKRIHRHVEGSGIGLYIIKRIIDNVNGRIEVESEENIGSKFKVYIPLTHEKSIAHTLGR